MLIAALIALAALLHNHALEAALLGLAAFVGLVLIVLDVQRERAKKRRPAGSGVAPPMDDGWERWKAYPEPCEDEKELIRLVIRSTSTERREQFKCFVQGSDGRVSTAMSRRGLEGRHQVLYPKDFDPLPVWRDDEYSVLWRHGQGEFVKSHRFTIKNGKLRSDKLARWFRWLG